MMEITASRPDLARAFIGSLTGAYPWDHALTSEGWPDVLARPDGISQ